MKSEEDDYFFFLEMMIGFLFEMKSENDEDVFYSRLTVRMMRMFLEKKSEEDVFRDEEWG